MQPTLVTFTGADDATSIDKMEDFVRGYPFVEFGILVSARVTGSPRYPSPQTRFQIARADLPNLSVHVQGALLRNLLVGGSEFYAEYTKLIHAAQRIQLNFHSGFVSCNPPAFWAQIDQHFSRHSLIFQCDGNKGEPLLQELLAMRPHAPLHPLFDQSGGAGILPNEWPKNTIYSYAGYAGGLGADNIQAQLPKISTAANGRKFWIDMETKVCCPETGLKFEEMRKVCDAVIAGA